MQQDLLAKVVSALDAAGVPHMVTGSFASTFHGEPRMTRDIDLVIDPDITSISLFVDQFAADAFYVNDAIAATSNRDMFNVVDVTTGWKVDLIIRKDRPFSREEFDRRVPVVIGGVQTRPHCTLTASRSLDESRVCLIPVGRRPRVDPWQSCWLSP